MKHAIEKIISGGQTGVDQAALRAARACGIAIGGWCPPDRASEAGPIPEEFALEPSPCDRSEHAPDVPRSQRTEWNVRDADATLILTPHAEESFDPGTRWTMRYAEKLGKPLLICDPLDPAAASRIAAWLRDVQPRVLNVAGPSESARPGIADAAFAVLTGALVRI